MKFKCNISGCVYTFSEPLDIKAMSASADYTVVSDEVVQEVVPAPDENGPATIAVVAPKPPAPDKPAPTAKAAAKAV